MTEVRLSLRARLEIRAAARWYLDRNPRAAAQFLQAVDHLLEQLGATPRLWPQNRHGARRAVVRRFPYTLYYRELQGEVVVVAVVHARRHPDAWRCEVDATERAD